MRDWLALPPSPTAKGGPSNNSSDEAATTDDYDIVHKSTTTEEETEELQGPEELSTWMSILSAFGVAKKIKKKSRSIDSYSSSASSTTIAHLKKDETLPPVKQDPLPCETHQTEHEDEGEDDDEISFTEPRPQQQELPRTDSSSSIASSTDSDNSTPALSEIVDSSSKYPSMTNTTETVMIHWNHGGKKVQVTGEFDNWSVDMLQDTENLNRFIAQVSVDSTKDIEFKFIVDGEWKYASDLPHRTDWSGNINNVIYKKHEVA
ncbi:hypothetical protein EDC96DRAFT_174660 [Choanephora cucurbitarum]|nr:hypothetical protein EDC96DRAFT_174660 [Choanephora cucurbitarum]